LNSLLQIRRHHQEASEIGTIKLRPKKRFVSLPRMPKERIWIGFVGESVVVYADLLIRCFSGDFHIFLWFSRRVRLEGQEVLDEGFVGIPSFFLRLDQLCISVCRRACTFVFVRFDGAKPHCFVRSVAVTTFVVLDNIIYMIVTFAKLD
jgi:hypothetical protein